MGMLIAIVMLAIQNAESGGDFQYNPHLRTRTDKNYPGVAAVPDGDTKLIRTLHLEPGDLEEPILFASRDPAFRGKSAVMERVGDASDG